LLEISRRIGSQLPERWRRVDEDSADDGSYGRAVEWQLAADHLVQHDAKRELIAAVVEVIARELFGRHVMRRADDHAGPGLRCEWSGCFLPLGRREGLREAEVENLDQLVAGDHDVRRLDVTVDDSGGMRFGQSVGDLRRKANDAVDRHRTVGDDVAQRPPVDELHRDVRRAVLLGNVVNRDDVRVVERRGRACLTLEACESTGVAGELRRKHFDGDVTPQLHMARAMYLAHAPRTDRAEDLVRTEPRSRNEYHAPPS
jgi:hypothetical protein